MIVIQKVIQYISNNSCNFIFLASYVLAELNETMIRSGSLTVRPAAIFVISDLGNIGGYSDHNRSWMWVGRVD